MYIFLFKHICFKLSGGIFLIQLLMWVSVIKI